PPSSIARRSPSNTRNGNSNSAAASPLSRSVFSASPTPKPPAASSRKGSSSPAAFAVRQPHATLFGVRRLDAALYGVRWLDAAFDDEARLVALPPTACRPAAPAHHDLTLLSFCPIALPPAGK